MASIDKLAEEVKKIEAKQNNKEVSKEKIQDTKEIIEDDEDTEQSIPLKDINKRGKIGGITKEEREHKQSEEYKLNKILDIVNDFSERSKMWDEETQRDSDYLLKKKDKLKEQEALLEEKGIDKSMQVKAYEDILDVQEKIEIVLVNVARFASDKVDEIKEIIEK